MKKIGLGLFFVGLALVGLMTMFFQGDASEKTYENSKRFQKIEVNDSNTSLTVVGVPGNKTTVKYVDSKNGNYTFHTFGNTLKIYKKRDLRLSLKKIQSAMTIQVPNDQLKSFKAVTSNSKIEVKNLNLGAATFKTSNNDIVLDKVSAKEELVAKSSNGQLMLSHLSFETGVFRTSNSKIDLSQINGKDVDARTSNEIIAVTQVDAEKNLSLETSNGDVQGILPGRSQDYAINAQASNGKSKLTNSTFGRKKLKIRTSNAQIAVDFEK